MSTASQNLRIRDLGYAPGIHSPGPSNSILDVPGVHISQVTVPTSSDQPANSTARKGVTVLIPRPPDTFWQPCRAGTFTLNGNGELTGARQIADWGYTNAPLALTNSLSLGSAFDAAWDWVLAQHARLGWDARTASRRYATPLVAETADWAINSRLPHSRVAAPELRRAFDALAPREAGAAVREGQAGGGAGMTCHMFAGGTGTASRRVGGGAGCEREYTLGVLVQANYGHLVDLVIGGVPVGRILKKEKDEREGAGGGSGGSGGDGDGDGDGNDPQHARGAEEAGGRADDGSIVIVVITDAPLASHQLARVARQASVGLAAVGSHGVGRNFSGDIFLALSTAPNGPQELERTHMRHMNPSQTYDAKLLKQESIDAYCHACAEAVEEAILNCLVASRDGVVGMDGTRFEGLPVDRVKELLDQYLVKV